jgi:H+-translocating NAD(P) transhydrogenase subunit alpha
VIADRIERLRDADMVLRLRKPPTGEVACLREGCIQISYLDPFNERDLSTSSKNWPIIWKEMAQK